MTANGKEAAALALHRFGFGPRDDSIAAIAADPRGAVLADLERTQAGQVAAELPSSAEAARAVFDFRAEEQARKKLAARATDSVKAAAAADRAAAAMADALGTPTAAASSTSKANEVPLPQQLFQNEARARFGAAINAEIGFVERLVWFWSNHFCVSMDKVADMAGPYEREAIRPHVLGRFADMLQAVESHPAMLIYLDNVQSMGANSIAGINRDKGLNENLARETLELHTLGVRTGYTQTDVTNFANVLTGWSALPSSEPEHGGEFAFFKRFHEPGAQVVVGKRYAQQGADQGRAVLADLARHPATAQHVAAKLAHHFIADEPPPELVATLTKAFQGSDGNLRELARALVLADASWTPQRTKLKAPALWVASALRLADPHGVVPIGQVITAQVLLGQPLWRPPAPNGFPDSEAAWLDGVPRRLDVANEFAVRLAADADPLALVDSGLGALASAATRDAVARAESRSQALALLMMAPEYLRS